MRMCITVFGRAAILAVFGVAAFLALGAYGIALADDEEAARYEVTVNFNTSVTQDDIDEVGGLLRVYDEDLDFVVLEIWPPIGRALLATDMPDFCQTVEAELGAKSYVDDVKCGSAAVETPVAPPSEVTATPPVAETPAPPPPVEETQPPVEETPPPVEETPQPVEPAPPLGPEPEEGEVIAPPPIEPGPEMPEKAIGAPATGRGSTSESSWPWWPLALAGAVAAGAGAVLLAYQGRRAKP